MVSKYLYLISVLWSFQVYSAPTNVTTCSYFGNTYLRGDTWVDEPVCDTCECNTYGVQCWAGLGGGVCKINKTRAHAGDAACRYNNTPYLVGDVFTAVDGCNKCNCTQTGMQCTAKSCKRSGFATGSKAPLYGDCLVDDTGLWYPYATQWLAADGCNTCYCYHVGNYRGQHVCTKSTCPTTVIAG